MNTTLTLGNLTFSSRLIQGPLAGYTCSAMRSLPWQFGGLAYTTTEMLSAHQMAFKQDRSPRYTHIAADEGPVCFQISGNQLALLAKAAEYAQEYGATLIDLNAGCPQPKIRKKGHGSALLTDTKQLTTLLQTIKQHCNCPVTLKIRIGDHDEAVLECAQKAGIDGLIVHGRTWKERYDVNASWDRIAWFVEQSDLPIIGNGDLNSPESIDNFFKHTQASGAMIARASLGQPWLFARYEAHTKNMTYSISPETVWQCFMDHITHLIALENNETLAISQARGFLKYYFPDSNETVRESFYKEKTLGDIQQYEEALTQSWR